MVITYNSIKENHVENCPLTSSYAAETSVLIKRDVNTLNTWEQKILHWKQSCERKWITEKMKQCWVVCTLQRHTNRHISEQGRAVVAQSHWAMPENHTVHKLFRTKPEQQRFKGWPCKRWINDVDKDLQKLGFSD